MHQETLQIANLAAWSWLNNVELNGVKISTLPEKRGSAVISMADRVQNDAVLMTIPRELVLSMENVWTYAKSDRHLLQVLEAIGDFARVPCRCAPAEYEGGKD